MLYKSYRYFSQVAVFFSSPMAIKYQKNAKTLKNSLYICKIKPNTYLVIT
jgi:hypothetical protein